MTEEMFLSITFLLLGMLMGSFYNVVGMRVPLKQSISYPNSHCPDCKTPLRWFELVPVLSYISVAGKCRTCKKRISIIYPIIELSTGLLFFATFLVNGLSVLTLFNLVVISLMVVLTVSDITTMLIPNKILLVFGVLLIPVAMIISGLDWKLHLLGFITAFIINLLILLFTKGNGMGGGDVKLFLLLGLLFGPKLFISLFYTSVLIGLIVGVIIKIKTKEKMFPFGPSIAVATIVNLFYGEHLVKVYLGFFV